MATSTQGSNVPLRGFGRSFAVADPERQREIDFIPSRLVVRRDEGRQAYGRPSPLGSWMAPPRGPADEGGSVRRSR